MPPSSRSPITFFPVCGAYLGRLVLQDNEKAASLSNSPTRKKVLKPGLIVRSVPVPSSVVGT